MITHHLDKYLYSEKSDQAPLMQTETCATSSCQKWDLGICGQTTLCMVETVLDHSYRHSSGVEFRKLTRESKWILAGGFCESQFIPANGFS